MYKITGGNCPDYLKNCVQYSKNIPNYQTRWATYKTLVIPKSYTSSGLHAFHPSAVARFRFVNGRCHF